MLDNQPLTINPAALEELAQALPCTPTLASWTSDNHGSLLLHYDQHPAHEVPEYVANYHVLAILGPESQAYLESTLDNRLNRGMFGRGANGVIPAGYTHQAVWDQEIALTVLFLHPTLLEEQAAELTQGKQFELLPKHDTEDPILSQLGQLLRLDLAAEYPSGRLYRESITTALVARLVSHHSACTLSQSELEDRLSQQRLHLITSYIREHLGQEIRLRDLAQLVGLSEYYLCRLFKKSIGIPLHQYVIQQRLEQARQLLQCRDLTIAHIAQECGFSSHSHLTQQFKRAFGVSPTVLRSQDFDRPRSQDFDRQQNVTRLK
jgi:AraC family transcriptional regulator